jgi:hypothetical protein
MLRKFALASVVAAIASAGVIHAEAKLHVVAIGHDFSRAGVRMPAGHYRIEVHHSPDVIVFRCVETGKAVGVLRAGVEAEIRSLEFRPVDKEWVLARIH